MAVDPRHCSVQPGSAIRVAAAHRRAELLRRLHAVVGISGHSALRTGTAAVKTRHDLRIVFGFAFGVGGVASAVLGRFADSYGIETIYHVCAYMPLLGVVAFPAARPQKAAAAKTSRLSPDPLHLKESVR